MESYTKQPTASRTRRVNRRAAAAIAAAFAVAVTAVIGASASASGGGKQTLRLVAHQTQYTYLDLGAKGHTPGDELVYREAFSKAGDETGETGIMCTMTNVAPPPSDIITIHCVGTFMLPHGQIESAGLMKLHGEANGEADPGPFRVAITGGTGRYLGVTGDAVVVQPKPGANRYIYKLRFDKRNG